MVQFKFFKMIQTVLKLCNILFFMIIFNVSYYLGRGLPLSGGGGQGRVEPHTHTPTDNATNRLNRPGGMGIEDGVLSMGLPCLV